ncbi:MAG TPA: SpoIID/LytB domain-containing protein [Acidimicrobiales bacterium]|nr:SpoIID/LytB domain-containing protein [Acidimicrobiales bacterium]
MSFRPHGWVAPLVLLVLLAAGTAAAAPARPAAAAPRAPAPGWTVAAARFEPLDPARPLVADGFGPVRGALEVRRGGAGVAVVDHLPLEQYLLGISEVPPSWPVEAQRAQAIAARTYAVHEILRKAPALAALGADLCATDSCQVYAGIAKERRPGAEAWAAAVMDTAGQVLLHRNAPILAKYSSTNGGRSIAGGYPYLRSVDDPDDAISPYHRWRARIALTDAAGALTVPGLITAVRLVGATVETDWLAADGTTGVLALPTPDFRARLNQLPNPVDLPLLVPSLRWSGLAVDGDVLVIDGSGWGHGVGMSQFGALGKARRGMRAADILASYYGGLRPVATRPGQLPADLRVLVQDAAGAVISGEGPFRVLDAGGSPIAVVGEGAWRVVPAGRGQVRIVPPAGQANVPAVTPLGIEPAAPAPGQPVQVRFHLSGPASVRVSLRSAGAAPIVLTDGLVGAGETVQQLPPIDHVGDYVFTIEADAGGGRASTAPVPVRVATPVAVSAAVRGPFLVDDEGIPAGWTGVVALVLLAAVSRRVWPLRSEAMAVARLHSLRPGDPRSG